jgi:hypothetical protein
MTGGNFQRGISINGGLAANCSTTGFKIANNWQGVIWSGLVSIGAGQYGFMVAGSADGSVSPTDMIVQGCMSLDVGAYGTYGSGTGFRIVANAGSPTWPRNVRIKNCLAVDRQATPTMNTGFASDVSAVSGTSGVQVNTVDGCEAIGYTSTAFSGLASPAGRITGTGTQSLTTAVEATVALSVEVFDRALQREGGNQFYTRFDMVVRVDGQVTFAANATGTRYVRITAAGNTIGEVRVNACSAGTTVVQVTGFVRGPRGQNIRLLATQDSGGALNIDMTKSFLTISKVSDWG